MPIVSVQNRYNLTDRSSEDVLDACERAGVAFIPWFPLATGNLARPGGALDEIAARHEATPGQVALGWLLAKSPVMLPIPGTSSVGHLEEHFPRPGCASRTRRWRRYPAESLRPARLQSGGFENRFRKGDAVSDPGSISKIRVLLVVAVAAIAFSLLAGCGAFAGRSSGEGRAEGSGSETIPAGGDGVSVETGVVATDLEAPWGLAFLPGGDALVTERDSGRLLRVNASGDVEEEREISSGGVGEGGLLGVALSPDYERDGLVYAYYSTRTDNRVVRFRLDEPKEEPILTGIPVNSYHNGGRIAFGPDGMLYVGTGDAGDTANAQNRGSLGGKILRVTPEGDVPKDNPFPNSPVYSLGHRNVQGLAWDADGQLYASEFGQNRFDEVNRIEAGKNYGWPEVEGEGGEPEYADPITTFDPAEASPSGVAILKGGEIPQWEGDLFVAALRGERLWRLELDGRGAVTEREQLLRDEAGRLRHVAKAPDGSLWVLTSNRDGRGTPVPEDDRILRLAPANG